MIFLSSLAQVAGASSSKNSALSILISTAALSTVIALISASGLSATAQTLTLSEKIVNMERGLEQEFEGYFGADLAEVTQPPEEIAKTLSQVGQETGTNPAVLWAIPKADHLHLVLITPSGEPIVRDLYDVPEDVLSQAVDDFHLEMNGPEAGMFAARKLHKWMIEPFEANYLKAEGIDTILFCLGNGLRSLPLAALSDGESFLLERYSLTRIPAFNLIQTDYSPIEQEQVLAMGASEFQELSPLPAVSAELENVLAAWKSTHQIEQTGHAFLNEDFTLANLKHQLDTESPDIVHLATHAIFKPGAPDNSYIQLWNEPLKLNNIRDVNWQNPSVELLVLSACRTAVGDDEAELGFAGITLQSGAKSALASIWNVSDTGTLALMSEFYQQMGSTSTKAEALRQAQLKMLRGEVRVDNDKLQLSRGEMPLPTGVDRAEASDLSSPYYWAAFTMVGSPW